MYLKSCTCSCVHSYLSEMSIWNQLISKIQTKYIYIGRNVIHFTRFDRLERLVREINNLNAYVVASAFRTMESGQVLAIIFRYSVMH